MLKICPTLFALKKRYIISLFFSNFPYLFPLNNSQQIILLSTVYHTHTHTHTHTHKEEAGNLQWLPPSHPPLTSIYPHTLIYCATSLVTEWRIHTPRWIQQVYLYTGSQLCLPTLGLLPRLTSTALLYHSFLPFSWIFSMSLSISTFSSFKWNTNKTKHLLEP